MVDDSLYALRKLIVPEVVFGAGALRLVGQYAVNFNLTHCLVVTDAGVASAGWSGSVVDALQAHGVSSTVFSDISANPRDTEVRQGVAVYRAAGL